MAISSPRRIDWFAGLIVIGVALVLRLAVITVMGAGLADDRDAYLGLARGLVAGDGFVSPGSQTPTAFRPPAYPLFVALVFAAGGGSLALGVAQAVLGCLTVGMTWWLGTRLGQSRFEGTALGLIAGLVVAFEPLSLANTALAMTETLATTLLVVWLAALLVPPTSLTSACVAGLSAGLCTGLGLLCRPILLPVFALGLAWAFVASRSCRATPQTAPSLKPTRSLSHHQILLLVVGLVAGLTLAPWAIRNQLVFGRPLLTTTHGGYTLLLGHNDVYYAQVVNGPHGAVWERDSLEQWQRQLDRELAAEGIAAHDELARDAACSRRAWDKIRENPPLAIQSGLTLLGRFWSLAPRSTDERPLAAPLRLGIALFNAALFSLAAVGLVSLWRRDTATAITLAIPLLVFSVLHSVYWSDQRMRAPLVPVLALLAAQGFVTTGQIIRSSVRTGPTT
jgi:hypothetical protein